MFAWLCAEATGARAVIIYFLEIEPSAEQFFGEALVEHDLRSATDLEDVGADAEVICTFIGTRVTADFLASHPDLRLIATRSTATDHIDVAACRERAIAVCHVPHYGETTVAEHTFALILALSRRLREVMQKQKDARFSYEETRGFDLAGKTMGIIGMGHVGQRVAALAGAFRMRVLAYDVQTSGEVAARIGFEFVSLNALLAEAHVISLHASLSPETYHILNRETLSRCRRGVLIVNTARGALLETAALRDALDSGQVGGAGLDVLQDERVLRQSASRIIAADIVRHLRSDALAREQRDEERVRELQEVMLGDAVLSRSNVVFTPHVAFNSHEAIARIREVTVANIQGFAAGTPVNLVP